MAEKIEIELSAAVNSDDLDFYDVGVGSIRNALLAAFKAGVELGVQINIQDYR